MSTQAIYDTEYAAMTRKYPQFTLSEFVEVSKLFLEVKSNLEKIRTKHRNKLPESIGDIVLDEKFVITTKSEKFLVYKSNGNGIMVFCSVAGLQTLSDSAGWHSDGTFYVSSEFFQQLYIIHGWYENRMIPTTSKQVSLVK